MTDLQELKVGDIVIWDGDPDDRGTVMATAAHGFEVEWIRGWATWIRYGWTETIERISVSDRHD